MWASSHVGIGIAIYEGVKDRPRWVKWPIVVVGGFTSHWLLDSIGIYHDVYIPFAVLTGCSIALLWWLSSRLYEGWQRILPPHMIAGGIFWLIWDFEWLLPFANGYWIHHPLLGMTWMGRRPDPQSTILELLLIFTVMLMTIPRITGSARRQPQLEMKREPLKRSWGLRVPQLINGRLRAVLTRLP